MTEALELESRRKIYDLIKNYPGLHLSKIAALLNMRLSLAEYHLFYLEKNKVIVSTKEAGYTRYYIKNKLGAEDKRILSILRQDTPMKIVLLLLNHGHLKHKDLLQNLDIAPSTLSYHLKKLVKRNIIEVQTYGDERGYTIINREKIIRLLVQFKPYNLVESFKDIWMNLTVD